MEPGQHLQQDVEVADGVAQALAGLAHLGDVVLNVVDVGDLPAGDDAQEPVEC